MAKLDFQQGTSGYGIAYEDRVALIVERPGVFHEKALDAAHPPESFAELVCLMDGWGAALRTGKIPTELTNVRVVE